MILRLLLPYERSDAQFDIPDVKWSLDLGDAEKIRIIFMANGQPWKDGWGSGTWTANRKKLAKACLSKV